MSSGASDPFTRTDHIRHIQCGSWSHTIIRKREPDEVATWALSRTGKSSHSCSRGVISVKADTLLGLGNLGHSHDPGIIRDLSMTEYSCKSTFLSQYLKISDNVNVSLISFSTTHSQFSLVSALFASRIFWPPSMLIWFAVWYE